MACGWASDLADWALDLTGPGPDGHRWTDKRTDGKSPDSTGLLYWGRCPASPIKTNQFFFEIKEEQGTGTADHYAVTLDSALSVRSCARS